MTTPTRSTPAPPPAAASFDEVRTKIARIPRVPIAIRPTPMVEAPNLTRTLGGPRIFVKRDDLTGVALGGNKLRNLEFRLARTMAERPDVVLVGLDPSRTRRARRSGHVTGSACEPCWSSRALGPARSREISSWTTCSGPRSTSPPTGPSSGECSTAWRRNAGGGASGRTS
jgi:hypothetical protein